MARHVAGLVLAGALVLGTTGYAHHSQAAQYDRTQQVTLDAKIVQFQFRNPHSFIHIEAPDETGEVHRWSVEWGGSGQLTLQGVNRNTLRYGDEVVLVANPSRTPNDYKLQIVSLHRVSDGWGWGTKPGEVVD